MADNTLLFRAIAKLYDQKNTSDVIKRPHYTPHARFPFTTMYKGQHDILTAMKDWDTLGYKGPVAITSHTGAGKTPVFLTLTRLKKTIVIEPRKFLQKQVQGYYSDFILFGQSEYKCKHARNAAIAPCKQTFPCNMTDWCHMLQKPIETKICTKKTPCRLFYYNADGKHNKGCNDSDVHYYPCDGCDYHNAVANSRRVLKDNGTVICNFGNFWSLLKHTDIVVIDEADLFFREISQPYKVRNPPDDFNIEHDGNIKKLLDGEIAISRVELKNAKTPAESYAITNKLHSLEFLNTYRDLCFCYSKKNKVYVEISPDKVSVLKDLIFADKKLMLISATLGDFDMDRYAYSVWQRRGIFFAPVGKMTSRNLAQQTWLMGNAAQKIEDISGIMEVKYDTHQFVVHCGNIGTHATQLYQLLGEDSCTLHEKGNLMKTIDDFTGSGKRYLLVASAEYGADFAWCKLQFVLKFPYASLDERMRVLERTMGSSRFKQFYLNDAITRIVQQCGRNVRGYGDFGITVILDSKFMEVYRDNENSFPDWFKEGFDGRVY